MGKIPVAVTDLTPPCQTETSGLITPDPFDPTLELIELPGHHLFQRSFADDPLTFEYPAVKVCDQPVGLVQDSAVDDPGGEYRGPDPDGRLLKTCLFIDDVRHGQAFVHVRRQIECRALHFRRVPD